MFVLILIEDIQPNITYPVPKKSLCFGGVLRIKYPQKGSKSLIQDMGLNNVKRPKRTIEVSF